MNKPAIIIFDFDGTIADTVGPGIRYANEILIEMGKNPISDKDLQLLRNQSKLDVLKHFNVTILEIPAFALKLRKRLRLNIAKMKPFKKMIPILNELKKRGYELEILTSNAKDIVELFLKNNNLTQFNNVTSEKNLFGKHITLGKVLRKKNLKPEDCVYLGDEVRDVEACKKADVPIISVTWGLQAEGILLRAGADYIAREPNDILDIIP